MNIRFIDTSVLLNILNVPGRNQNHIEVMLDFRELIKARDVNTLILPLATIIETAHISNGDERRKRATIFAQYLEKTAKGEAPWEYYCKELDKEDLSIMAKEFPNCASMETGIGDMSIIRAYEKYKDNTPAIGNIMIWSLDGHLKGYNQELKLPVRRRSK